MTTYGAVDRFDIARLQRLATHEAEVLTGPHGPIPALRITSLPCHSCRRDERHTMAGDLLRTPLGWRLAAAAEPTVTLVAYACELLGLRQTLAVTAAVQAGARELRTRAVAAADLPTDDPLAVLACLDRSAAAPATGPWTLPISTEILDPEGRRHWRVVGHHDGAVWAALTDQYVSMRDAAVRARL